VTLAIGDEIALDISSLGAQGDGIGQLDGATVRLEYGLPGEHWRASLLARRRDGWDAAPVRRLAGPERALGGRVDFTPLSTSASAR
jgi:tRNA/tmRNA/rRNA uracil-C5-methylase (TrmA/RlmC/RlmD family)